MEAWACVGSNGNIFVTDFSPHDACVGRLQVYLKKEDALRNDIRVVKVKITRVREKKK